MTSDAAATTALAVERTRLAHERTTLAWIRTATSLISFGFSIYKFFDHQVQQATHTGAIGPRNFALILIALGLGALGLAALQHHRDLQALRAVHGHVARSSAEVVGILIAALGILAFVSVLFRL
jgi:putative membrane protein